MTGPNDREEQQAELLWKYIEELKKADNPAEVQFVAITSGECAEVVGVMETAAEAYAVARAAAAPNCRREAIRERLQAAITDVQPATTAEPSAAAHAARRLPPVSWLISFLTGRSTGWAAAAAAFAALIWIVSPRAPVGGIPRPVPRLDHAQTLRVVPALIKGRLDPEQSSAAWEHLRQCEHCFELYEAQWRAAQTKPTQTGQAPRTGGYVAAFVAWKGHPQDR